MVCCYVWEMVVQAFQLPFKYHWCRLIVKSSRWNKEMPRTFQRYLAYSVFGFKTELGWQQGCSFVYIIYARLCDIVFAHHLHSCIVPLLTFSNVDQFNFLNLLIWLIKTFWWTLIALHVEMWSGNRLFRGIWTHYWQKGHWPNTTILALNLTLSWAICSLLQARTGLGNPMACGKEDQKYCRLFNAHIIVTSSGAMLFLHWHLVELYELVVTMEQHTQWNRQQHYV